MASTEAGSAFSCDAAVPPAPNPSLRSIVALTFFSGMLASPHNAYRAASPLV